MPRYKITLEYEGTPFVGWQWQANGLSIQQILQEALEKFSYEHVLVEGAGRTDAGVHARGQVAHFDLSKEYDPYKVMTAVNFFLRPHPIAILKCERVEADFHARFSANFRRYRYIILNRKALPILDQHRVWWVSKPLDVQKMQEAAQYFIGQHDFTTFRATSCQSASPIKTIDSFEVRSVGEQVWLEVQAKSFLHHQVRNITGTLKLIGEGKWSCEDLKKAMIAKSRAAGGPTAPASGLYFMSVGYRNESNLKK